MLKKIVLLLSYLIIFYMSLGISLSLRHFDLRGWEFYKSHLLSFSIVFLIWIFILYSTRLFDLHIILNIKKLNSSVIKASVLNFLTGTAFFYFSQSAKQGSIVFKEITITPRANLLLTAIISGILIYILLRIWSKISKYNPIDARLVNINITGKARYETEKRIKIIKKSIIYDLIKNIIDKITGFFALLILILLFIPIAILIKLNDRGAVFYKQSRIGKNEKIFQLLKFRSMLWENKKTLWTEKNDNRVTFVGKFLRKTHLDELPQCINILRGEMSIVGPRPEQPKFVNIIKKEQPLYYLRHRVKPGITGWAQLHYLYGDSIENNLKKLRYDLWYVKNSSVLLDLIIIIKTISVILDNTGR
ncbi:MAG: sugar transferase [Patescibacteria group bacterium]